MMDKFCKECAYAPKSDECHTCKVSCFDGEPMGLPSNFKRKPQQQTNADRIRAMSDEELANFIMYGFSTDFYGTLMHDKIMFFSTDSMMEWLKQPAEEDLRCRV